MKRHVCLPENVIVNWNKMLNKCVYEITYNVKSVVLKFLFSLCIRFILKQILWIKSLYLFSEKTIESIFSQCDFYHVGIFMFENVQFRYIIIIISPNKEKYGRIDYARAVQFLCNVVEFITDRFSKAVYFNIYFISTWIFYIKFLFNIRMKNWYWKQNWLFSLLNTLFWKCVSKQQSENDNNCRKNNDFLVYQIMWVHMLCVCIYIFTT